ncbi:sodium/hydrogen exchanger [Burkholderia multivorans CGD1]|nr:sodium/hydrogen exchanger [Burkholderia multivorans CGD1]
MQGGTLAPLIRALNLQPAARHTMSEHAVRAHTFGAALAALDARGPHGAHLERASLERLLTEYRNRVAFNERAYREGAEPADVRARMLRVELELVGVSRDALLALHRDGRVDDAVLHRIESELDFEELRLQRLLEP